MMSVLMSASFTLTSLNNGLTRISAIDEKQKQVKGELAEF